MISGISILFWPGHTTWRVWASGGSLTGWHMGIWKKRPGTSISTTVEPPGDLKIEISQSAGVVRVLDPRIFREDRRAWCRALVDHAAGCRDVRSVRLDLETAACEIQFLAQPSAHAMAGVLAASLRAADVPNSSRLPARQGWFAPRSSGR